MPQGFLLSQHYPKQISSPLRVLHELFDCLSKSFQPHSGKTHQQLVNAELCACKPWMNFHFPALLGPKPVCLLHSPKGTGALLWIPLMPRPTAKKPGHMRVHDSPENPRVRINRQVPYKLYNICLLQLPFKAAMWSACVSSFSFERCLPTHLGAANDVGSLHLPWLPGLPTSLVAGVDTRLALSCLHESTLNSGLSQPGKKEKKTFRQILPKHLIWPTSCNCKLNWGTSYALSKPGSHHKSQVPQAGRVLPTVLQNEEPMHHAWNSIVFIQIGYERSILPPCTCVGILTLVS